MRRLHFIGEPVHVEGRLRPEGDVDQVVPVAFTWRGIKHTVIDWGRSWREKNADGAWDCILVRSPGGDTFDLRRSAVDGRWILARAWLDDRVMHGCAYMVGVWRVGIHP